MNAHFDFSSVDLDATVQNCEALAANEPGQPPNEIHAPAMIAARAVFLETFTGVYDRLIAMDIDKSTAESSAKESAEEFAREEYHRVAAEMEQEIAARTAPTRIIGDRVEAEVAKRSGVIPALRAIQSGASVAPETMDELGRVRSERDKAAALDAGFAVAEVVYTRGYRVNETGVANAKLSRKEHNEKPLVADYCAAFCRKIESEHRSISTVRADSIRMTPNGALAVDGEAVRIGRATFASMVTKLGYGGAEYLGRCNPSLRAQNVNAWSETLESPDKEIALRLRNGAHGKREAFAVVSPKYTAYDSDKIARAIAQAAPADARGTVVYDGAKSRFEVMFHSDIAPEDYVCGEFFKAGVVITTDDTGGGAVIVKACFWQNLCFNLIILDIGESGSFSIRHLGSERKMAAKFREAFAAAIAKIGHFIKSWGYACHDAVQPTAKDAPVGRAALPGIFNGLLEKGLKLPGYDKKQAIDALIAAWSIDMIQDKSSATLHHGGINRAAICNAITRTAHTLQFASPFASDDVEAFAGGLLSGKDGAAPAPLPYLEVEVEAPVKVARR